VKLAIWHKKTTVWKRGLAVMLAIWHKKTTVSAAKIHHEMHMMIETNLLIQIRRTATALLSKVVAIGVRNSMALWLRVWAEQCQESSYILKLEDVNDLHALQIVRLNRKSDATVSRFKEQERESAVENSRLKDHFVKIESQFETLRRASANRGVKILDQFKRNCNMNQHQALLRIWHGATLTHLMNTRVEAKAQAEHLAFVQAEAYKKMVFDLESQCHSMAFRILKDFFQCKLKGTIGLRFHIWRSGMQDEQRYEAFRGIQKKLKKKMKNVSRGAGIRVLKQVFSRLVKGSVGLRLEIWRQNLHQYMLDRYAQRESALQARYESHRFEAGFKAMGTVFGLLTDHAVRFMLNALKMNHQTHRSNQVDAASKLAQKKAKKRTRKVARVAGLRCLRVTLTALLTDVISLAVRRWRTATEASLSRNSWNHGLKRGGFVLLKHGIASENRAKIRAKIRIWNNLCNSARLEKHSDLVKALERSLNAHGHNSGLLILSQTIRVRLQGRLALYLRLWHQAVDAYRHEMELVLLRCELERKAVYGLKGMGLRGCDFFLCRIIKGHMFNHTL